MNNKIKGFALGLSLSGVLLSLPVLADEEMDKTVIKGG